MADERNLRIKRQYSVVVHGPDEVELRSGVWNPISFTVSDETRSGKLHRLVGRLDGSLSPAQIARQEDVPREEVESLVDHLQGLGVLESGASTALDLYLDQVVPWRAGEEARTDRPVVLLGDSELGEAIAGMLAPSLPDAPISSAGADDPLWQRISGADSGWLDDSLRFEEALESFSPWRGALVVCASRAADPVRLRTLNRVCVALGVPWLHAAVDGPFLLVGPTVLPHRSACYECLETRVTMNLREGASYQRYKQALVERRVRLGALPLEPALVGLVAAHTALEALNILATGTSFTVGKILSIYLPVMELSYNEVLRAPGCSVCGPVAERDDSGLYFDMTAFLDGGGR